MKSFLEKHLNYSVFFIILFVLISIKIINPSFVKSVSYLSFDLYQKLFSEKKDSEVIIIDIDEQSLGKFGQFPWNRTVFAKILEQVNASNPKVVGFDIFFTEKDKQSPDEIIKSYKSKTFHGYNNVFFITHKYNTDQNIINLDLNNLVLTEENSLNLQFEGLSSNFESIIPTVSSYRFLVGNTPAKLNEEVACSLQVIDRFISKQLIPGEAFLNTSLSAELSSGIIQGQSFDESYYSIVQAATGENTFNQSFSSFFNFIQDGRARIVFDNLGLGNREDPILDSIESKIYDINSVGERLFVQYVNTPIQKGFVQEFTSERFKLSSFELSKPIDVVIFLLINLMQIPDN